MAAAGAEALLAAEVGVDVLPAVAVAEVGVDVLPAVAVAAVGAEMGVDVLPALAVAAVAFGLVWALLLGVSRSRAARADSRSGDFTEQRRNRLPT